MQLRIEGQRPIHYFVSAIRQAESGAHPQVSINDALTATNLLVPQLDGLDMEERLFGGIPQTVAEVVFGLTRAIISARPIFQELEDRVRERRSSPAEDQVARLWFGVLMAHHMRGEEFCPEGVYKINSLNKERPNLIRGVLDNISQIGSVFPSPELLERYRREIIAVNKIIV